MPCYKQGLWCCRCAGARMSLLKVAPCILTAELRVLLTPPSCRQPSSCRQQPPCRRLHATATPEAHTTSPSTRPSPSRPPTKYPPATSACAMATPAIGCPPPTAGPAPTVPGTKCKPLCVNHKSPPTAGNAAAPTLRTPTSPLNPQGNATVVRLRATARSSTPALHLLLPIDLTARWAPEHPAPPLMPAGCLLLPAAQPPARQQLPPSSPQLPTGSVRELRPGQAA